jgi:hypothetical protein
MRLATLLDEEDKNPISIDLNFKSKKNALLNDRYRHEPNIHFRAGLYRVSRAKSCCIAKL